MPRVQPPRTPNKRGEGGRLREDILAAAHGILETTGTEDALTLRAVAREAGVTAPAIYRHFADRYEILRTVVESSFAELAVAMRAAAQGQADPVARLRAVCGAYLDFAAERPHHYRVLFERHRVTAAKDEEAQPDVRTMVGADAFGELLAAVGACISSGASGAASVEEATTRVWIGLHGQATLQASLPWFPWPDARELAESIMIRLGDLDVASRRRDRGRPLTGTRRALPVTATRSDKGYGMADKKGKGSDTARRANAKASKEGKKNPRTSSAAQAELGKKGAKSKKS